jgi:hypothetical protein
MILPGSVVQVMDFGLLPTPKASRSPELRIDASARESYRGNKIVARLRGMTQAIALALIFFGMLYKFGRNHLGCSTAL